MLTKEVYPKRLPFALFAPFSEMVEYSLVTQNYITEQCSYWKLVPLDASFQLVQDAVDYFYNGLIQAFSRTNRILNSVKVFGNIVCFRDLQQATDDAIALFGSLLKSINILSTFDQFDGREELSDRQMQDYQSHYLDLRDKWRSRKTGEKENINDALIFETELIRQVEINIDYILLLVQKYHDSNCTDKEILVNISKAIGSSLQLRSKKELIEKIRTFFERYFGL